MTHHPSASEGRDGRRRSIAAEVGPMLRLAGPVVLAELGWMAMGVVDVLVVGPLGAAATGAVGLGTTLFLVAAIGPMSLLLGLDALVPIAHGAGRLAEARRSLAQGLLLALALTPPVMALAWVIAANLDRIGIDPSVGALTRPYLDHLAWGTGPLLAFVAIRRYLQGINVVRPITIALVAANVVNLLACWGLVRGGLGLPTLGVAGAGWATSLARLYLGGSLVVTLLRHDPGARAVGDWLRPDGRHLRHLLALGTPAAVHVGLEFGVFGLATTLAGRLDEVSLASHQIALTVASTTFMVPLGVASAAAVRVGQAIGRKDGRGAASAGWTALMLGVGFMAASGVGLLLGSGRISGQFTGDARVIALAGRLFLLAAAFQLWDGLQVVAAGALRGAGETRWPMLGNLVAHWFVGLPLGWTLAFRAGSGVLGLWVGLATGLTVAGLVNLALWARAARRLRGTDWV